MGDRRGRGEFRRLGAACIAVALLAGCAAKVPVTGAAAPPAEAPADATSDVVAEAVPAVPVAGATAAAAAPLVLAGELRQGAMVVGKVVPGSRVRIGDRDLRVADDGTFVFGLDRDAPPQVTIEVTLADGKPWQETRPVQGRQYNIQRVTGIAERIMNPSKADLKRIDQENARIAVARARNDERLDFLQPFTWPTLGPITGVYGSQRFYNGVAKRPHYGVDVGVPSGTPVAAPAGGIVTLAAPDMFYSGGTLIIDHGHGVSSTLMHLSAILVREGDRVEQGQVVARSGASGRVSGAHLDWRMNWFGEHIDPQLVVGPMPAPAAP